MDNKNKLLKRIQYYVLFGLGLPFLFLLTLALLAQFGKTGMSKDPITIYSAAILLFFLIATLIITGLLRDKEKKTAIEFQHGEKKENTFEKSYASGGPVKIGYDYQAFSYIGLIFILTTIVLLLIKNPPLTIIAIITSALGVVFIFIYLGKTYLDVFKKSRKPTKSKGVNDSSRAEAT